MTSVSGYRRVPEPPARIIPFIGWTSRIGNTQLVQVYARGHAGCRAAQKKDGDSQACSRRSRRAASATTWPKPTGARTATGSPTPTGCTSDGRRGTRCSGTTGGCSVATAGNSSTRCSTSRPATCPRCPWTDGSQIGHPRR